MLREIAEVVLAECLEIVQQAVHHRRSRRCRAALVAGAVVEVGEQRFPGAVAGWPLAALCALVGAREHHDGEGGGERLRGYLGRLFQVRAAGGQFVGCIRHHAPMLGARWARGQVVAGPPDCPTARRQRRQRARRRAISAIIEPVRAVVARCAEE